MFILTYNCKSGKYKISISQIFLVGVSVCSFIFFPSSHLVKSYLCVLLVVLKLFCACVLFFNFFLLFLFTLALFFYGRAPP